MADAKSAKKTIYESQESLYQKAVAKMRADELIVQPAYKISNYLLAASMFEEVGDYLDAPGKAMECRKAAQKAEEESIKIRYEAADFRMKTARFPDEWRHLAEEFEAVGDYKDAVSKARLCRDQIGKDQKKRKLTGVILGIILAAAAAAGCWIWFSGFYRYAKGLFYMKGRQYTAAADVFAGMDGYMESSRYEQECRAKALLAAEVGDDVFYGIYKWKVLSRDDSVVTMIAAGIGSDHPFYRQPFDKDGGETDWAGSSLREWLNGEALELCFSEADRSHLVLQTSAPSHNEDYGTAYEETTEDYLTLLTAEEAEEEKTRALLESLSQNYWLRTPGHTMDTAALMDGGHIVRTYGLPTDDDQMMVRPVIRVDCSFAGE